MRLAGIGIIVLALMGCSPWPPHEDELTTNFQRHRSAFEELANMFSASPYPYVQTARIFMTEENSVDLGSDVLRQFKTTEDLVFYTGEFDDDGREFSDQPLTDPALIALMNTVGLPELLRGSEGARIIFDVRSSNPTDNQPSVAYMRDPVSKAKLQLCKQSFRAYDCGQCKIDLDDDWYLFYVWSPPQHELLERYGNQGVYESYLLERQKGGMLSDEAWEDIDASLDACKATSEQAINYGKDLWEGA